MNSNLQRYKTYNRESNENLQTFQKYTKNKAPYCLPQQAQVITTCQKDVESSWNVMAHGDAREGKWRGNWQMGWVASTLHTTLEHGVSSITTADGAHLSRLNCRPRRFKWNRLFRRKTNSGFCAYAITFQLASTAYGRSRTMLITQLY